jgi:CRP/FNR family transcriptional regulator
MNIRSGTSDLVDLRCEHCPARHHAVCKSLDDEELHILSDMMTHRTFERGNVIWNEEDESQQFAIVISGIVKLVKTLLDGRQQVVGLLFASDFLGRVFSPLNESFAEAATDVTLCCFPRLQFERTIKEHPKLEHALFEKTLDSLDDARNWMVALGRKGAGEKVASFLLRMSQRTEFSHCPTARSGSNLPVFDLPIRRYDIADFLGLTIETVSRQLTKLKVQNVIKLVDTSTIEISNPDALRKLADSD